MRFEEVENKELIDYLAILRRVTFTTWHLSMLC